MLSNAVRITWLTMGLYGKLIPADIPQCLFYDIFLITKRPGDEPDRRHIKSAALLAKSTSDRSTVRDLWDLAQKSGNDASRTLNKPDCDLCEKLKISRGLRGEGTV